MILVTITPDVRAKGEIKKRLFTSMAEAKAWAEDNKRPYLDTHMVEHVKVN
jgi:hypothetical protein